MGEIYAKIFIAIHIPFFSQTHLQVRPFGGFLRDAESVRSRCLHVDDTGRRNAERAKTDNFIGAIMLLLEHDVITSVVRMRK